MKIKILTVLCCFKGMLCALPQSPSVAAGIVEMVQEGSLIELFASDHSIVNWEGFSIEEGEKARFILPSNRAAILNRVTGYERSDIFGDLECNGQFILVNPSGILIGKHGKIDTGSLILTTLDCLDSNFLMRDKNLHFLSANAEGIENQGVIESERNIMLIAPAILQNGLCAAPAGAITLASCQEAILDTGEEKIRILKGGLEKIQEEGIHCGGVLNALEARLLADGSLSALAMNLDGIISATDIAMQDGKIILEAPCGTLALQGNLSANEVLIQADQIELKDSSSIHVASQGDGGKCRIECEKELVMSSLSRIEASSLGTGDGGEVILVSQGKTSFEGIIHAQGGPLGGDGGFVEVSGALLVFQGEVSTFSPLGKTGTLLLDPLDITISSAASALVSGLPNGPFSPMASACAPGPGNAILLDTDLINALTMNSVVIDTTGTVGACPGDIIFDSSAAVSYNTANTLTLSAAGAIFFNSSVINMGSGGISITAATDVNVIASMTGISVETNGGTISIAGVTGDLNVQGGTAGGSFARIFSPGGAMNIDVVGDINVIGGTAANANADIRATVGTMTISRATNISAIGGTDVNARGAISTGTNGDIFITCSGDLVIDTTVSAAQAAVSADGDLNATIGGNLTVNAETNGFALMNGSFAVNAVVQGDITVNGNGTGFATIFGDRLDALIQAGGSIFLNGNTQFYSGNVMNTSLTVIAGVSIQTVGPALFNSFAPGNTGSIALVVDNLFPTAPGVGGGQFILSGASMVDAMGGRIQIFTALPAQNMINGTLAGLPFIPGPPLTDTNNDRYGVYFPNSFFVSDYVVFYKIPGLTPNPGPISNPPIAAAAQSAFADYSEAFRLLHPYSEYIYGSIRFQESYQNQSVLFGIDLLLADDLFRLREKSYPREWFEIEYDPDKL